MSGLLRYEERGEKKLYYFYDASGNLSAIRYYPANSTDGYMYYPLTNSRGDVVSIYNSSGTPVVTYEYDAWGNCTIVSDTSSRNIGELNPIRYRGYYYDTETGLYYLQSRYYNPQVGRFLNSDNITDSNAGILGYNTFLYCANNPVNACDPTGHSVTIGALAGIGVAIGTIIKGAIALVAPYAAKILVALGTTAVGAAVCGGISYAKTKSQARAKAAEEADTIIKDTVKEDSHDRYWKASKINGVVTIGNAIDYNTAVEEVKAGRNVFTVTRAEAEMVASVAGGNTDPMPHPKHGEETNFYEHYHINNHGNGAHVWYLF